MPVPHHSVFTGWMPFLPSSQQCQSTPFIQDENLWRLVEQGFVGLDILPVTQPSVFKHLKEDKVLMLTGGVTSSFLCTPPDF